MPNNILLNEYIKTSYGKTEDMCAYFYLNYIKDQDDDTAQDNLITYLSHNEKSEETFWVKEIYSKSEYEQAFKEIFGFFNSIINNLVRLNLEENEFYNKLLTKINDDTIFESDCKKSVAIMILMASLKIPYFKLDQGRKIDEDEYDRIINENLSIIQKSLFIVNAELEQNTETASLLLKLIDEQNDENVKSVILANILSFFDYRFQMLYDTFNNETSKESE